MILRKWDDLPDIMRCDEVKEYYDVLASKKFFLVMKRGFDFVVALILFIILLIPMAIIAILIKFDSPGKILYRQERVTRYGKHFKIHKFRTMVSNADKIGNAVTVGNDSRVTKIGAKLRRLRLDELPQVIDVLVGDMSFVGTRPEATKYVEKYRKEYYATLLLPAGITSEASIRYKDEAELLENAENIDKIYVEEILPGKMEWNLNSIRRFSCLEEFKIMFKTVFALLGRIRLEESNMNEKKPLIALITNNDDDVYCFRKELIEELISEGYEMLISCPNGPKFDLIKDIPFRYDDPVIDRRGTNVVADGKLFLHYKKLFKKEKPDVILTYTAKPNVYASIAAKTLGIPYINNVTGIGSVVNMSGIKKAFILWLYKFAYRGASYVMFQNAANMKLAIDTGMVKVDYQLIPGSGVDIIRYPVQNYPSGGDGKTGDLIVFNYIGRVLHDKGVDDYIEAAKRIKKNYPNTEFNMLGFIEPTENHYEKDLAELGEQGVIYYRGSQKNVKPWITRAHAIIHPSTYGEGMSNVLLENAASARFLITTDNSGCREAVIDGKSGYIYHGGDVDALVKAIEKFLDLDNDTRKMMGLEGRRHVENNFSRDIVVAAYKEKIKKILRS